jgi:hypothetical protein
MNCTWMHETRTTTCTALKWMIELFMYKNVGEELEYPQIEDNLQPITGN